MNFLTAVKHAAIGYGIRRKVWAHNSKAILHLDNFGLLCWISTNQEAVLLGYHMGKDIVAEDIQAQDWETV